MAQRLFLLVSVVMVFLSSQMMFANGTEEVQVNVTRTGCGETKLCLDEPVGCDPAVAGSSCLFAAIVGAPAEAPNGKSLTITLSGETTGYIAIGLTANSSVGATAVFVCGQRNGTFLFSTTQNNNSTLTNGDTPVEDIVGQVNGSVIQCEFTVPNATATGSSHVTTFVVELGTGTINGTTLGPFSVKKTVGPLDVTNLANEVAQTTATPTLNVTTMPMNVTTMPMNVTTMPMNVTTMPMNVTTMPMNVTTMPMNATTSQNSATQPTSSAVAFLSSVGKLQVTPVPCPSDTILSNFSAPMEFPHLICCAEDVNHDHLDILMRTQ